MQTDVARALAPGTFFGRTTSLRRCGAVLSEVRHDRARICKEHVHEAAYFSLLLDGRYRETSGAVTVDYRPFTIAFHPPMTSHHDAMGDATRVFMIELGAEWLETIASYGAPITELQQVNGEDATWLAVRLHQEYLRGDDATDLAIEPLLFELCGSAAEHGARADIAVPAWLASVELEVERNAERRFDLRALAATAGVHPTHLARTFRRFHGRSLGDYVTGLRIQRACRALAATDDPLSAIAADAGFTDQAHFTRTFHEVVGTTPARYRRAHRASTNGSTDAPAES
ncbi:MAG: AraC family transcriptional regulator [Candidatus Eremiobacteraeota bacterium]|nr:AraC family transcriptional regulator [Candidatus Eremiobacteraeota bacterium]